MGASMVSISVSEEMKNILNQFKSNSLVASLLLMDSIDESELVEDHVDYISVSKEDMLKISYLSKDRYKTAIAKGQNPWTTGHRFHVRPGAFINKIFKNVPAKEIEIFSMLWKLHNKKSNFNFSIEQGNNIKRWYFYDNYIEQTGSLGNSCMKHDHCQSFFSMYAQNKGIVKLLIMTCSETDYLIGRALLWEFDGNKIMDRIYTVNDEEYAHHFKIWADKNGYMYKVEQKWNNTVWFMNAGKKVDLKLKVKLNNFVFDRYPYVDTFKFLDFETGTAYNHIPDGALKMRTLCASDGRYYGQDYLGIDELDGLFYHKGEIAHLQYKNLKVHISKVFRSNINGISILKEDAIRIDNGVSDYIFIEKYKEFNNKELIIRSVKSWESQAMSSDDGTRRQVCDMVEALNAHLKYAELDEILKNVKEFKNFPKRDSKELKSKKEGIKRPTRFSPSYAVSTPQVYMNPTAVAIGLADEEVSTVEDGHRPMSRYGQPIPLINDIYGGIRESIEGEPLEDVVDNIAIEEAADARPAIPPADYEEPGDGGVDREPELGAEMAEIDLRMETRQVETETINMGIWSDDYDNFDFDRF